MRKNGTWIYVGLFAILVLLFSGLLLLGRGGGTPQIRTGKQETAEARSLPPAGTNAPIADPAQERININTADPEVLQTLPGIGETRARAIVEYREQNGPFQSLSDLTLVKGIGLGTFENIKDKICLEDNYEDIDH